MTLYCRAISTTGQSVQCMCSTTSHMHTYTHGITLLQGPMYTKRICATLVPHICRNNTHATPTKPVCCHQRTTADHFPAVHNCCVDVQQTCAAMSTMCTGSQHCAATHTQCTRVQAPTGPGTNASHQPSTITMTLASCSVLRNHTQLAEHENVSTGTRLANPSNTA
jgi:hypothetical protein